MGLGLLAFSDAPKVAAVSVSGARHVGADAARAASGLVGAPLFRASAAQARATLLRLPAVRDARVDVALPAGDARIALVEREAVGRWVVGGVEWFVDAGGVLFASADASAAPSLRVRDTRSSAHAAGDRIDAALVAAAMRLAAVAPGELRADAVAPRVRVDAGASGLVLESGAGWEVRFGEPVGIEEKLALAERTLRERGDQRLEYVDVRTAGFIVVK